MKHPRRIAAIDIGSNTIHLVTMDLVRSRPPSHYRSVAVVLKLGAIAAENASLPPAVYRKLHHTLKHFLHLAKKDQASPVLISATQAMRTLPHGEKVLARLSRELQVPIHLLSPQREAELGVLGIRSELHPRECQLIIDSGGGSTEMTLVRGTKLIESVSIPLGAAVLSTRLRHDPPTAFETVRLMIPIIHALRQAPSKAQPQSALLTGGTVHHLLHVAKADPHRLTRRDLEHAIKRLLHKPARKIAKKYDMEVERVRLLVPGALLVTALLDHYNLNHLRITSRGLRDGMVYAYLKKGASWWKN